MYVYLDSPILSLHIYIYILYVLSINTHQIKVKIDAIIHITQKLKYSEPRAQSVRFGLDGRQGRDLNSLSIHYY